MNRLQKKCLVASAGTHLLLAMVLIVGPAFIASTPKSDDMPVLDFIPLKTTDQMMSGGGRPDGRLPSAPAPAPKPPAPAPAPPPPQQRAPDPVKPVEQARNEPEPSFEPAVHKQQPKPFHLEPIKPKSDASNERQKRLAAQQAQQAREEERSRQRQWEDSMRRTADAFTRAANDIEGSTASSTSVALKGPGGGGIPYANFLQAVKSRYANAWVVPDGIADDNATVAVSVTIARSGSVVSSRITRSSGNAAVDRSVQVTLDRVTWVAPLPEESTESQRTVSINFNVRAKKALG